MEHGPPYPARSAVGVEQLGMADGAEITDVDIRLRHSRTNQQSAVEGGQIQEGLLPRCANEALGHLPQGSADHRQAVLTNLKARMNPESVETFDFDYNDKMELDSCTRTAFSYGRVISHKWKIKKSIIKSYIECGIGWLGK